LLIVHALPWVAKPAYATTGPKNSYRRLTSKELHVNSGLVY
jgi:hypothetical protein